MYLTGYYNCNNIALSPGLVWWLENAKTNTRNGQNRKKAVLGHEGQKGLNNTRITNLCYI